jgi:dUTP pyrophosphatase
MTNVIVPLIQLEHGQDLPLPAYATALAAGVDLYAANDEDITLDTLDRALIPTGIAIALPAGYEAQIRPRSGLAFKQGISLVNTPGTIDADYRGEIKVLLINLGKEPVVISRGMRIAQMVIAPVSQVQFQLSESLDDTARGSGGFGSTGVKALSA